MVTIDRKTFFAVGELIQAAAHQHGVVGPVPFTVSRPKYYEWCDLADDFAEAEEEKDAK
ncbi:MAG: hypothetical protein KF831_10140 [Acidobacteria bacterium]|nr:hypothetical protein [Acidobacteriota bacterium]